LPSSSKQAIQQAGVCGAKFFCIDSIFSPLSACEMNTYSKAHNVGELSFDEFSAISKREKAKAKRNGDGDDEEEEIKPMVEEKGSFGIGDFLEMPQMQTFVVLLLFLDLLTSFGHIVMTKYMEQGDASTEVPTEAATSSNADPAAAEPLLQSAMTLAKAMLTPLALRKALEALASFTIFFFSLEMLAIITAFQTSAIFHIGYLFDSVIVSIQLMAEFTGRGLEYRILNFFRLWRLARLFNYLVNLEKEAHDATREVLLEKDASIRQLEGASKRISLELEKEKEARAAVDEMLASYKEEVETLNEALKIAAMDIAEVAEADDDLLLSDDEVDDELSAFTGSTSSKKNTTTHWDGGGGGGGSEDADFLDASSSKYDRARNKEALLREARRDSGGNKMSLGEAAQKKANVAGSRTILIREDGKYEER